MRLVLFFVFVFLSLLVLAEDECPPGYHPIEYPPGSGNIMCEIVDIVCPGINRDYTIPGTKTRLCCPSEQHLVIYNDNTREGICCDAGRVYVGQKPNGRCCNPGQVVRNGECTTPHHDGPNNGGTPCESCPKQPHGACNLQAACGDSKTNGLKYGRCYRLTFPETGKQLGRGRSGAPDEYIQDGYIQNIVYRICKSAFSDHCGAGLVSVADKFYVQDITGGASDTAGLKSWDDSSNGAHMSLTTDPTRAGAFSGETSCSGCKCVVRLHHVAYACPATQPGITYWPNPKVGLNLQFTEVPCDGDFVNFTPGK